MSEVKVVLESPRWWHWIIIQYCLLRRIPVWVVEPFHAYHHSKTRILWYPEFLPTYVERLIEPYRAGLSVPSGGVTLELLRRHGFAD